MYRSTTQDTQNPISPFAPSSPGSPAAPASVTQRSRVDRLTFTSPISAPSCPAGVASFALRVSFLPPRCLPGQSPSLPVPLSSLQTQGRLSPFARPTPLQRCSLGASPVWLLRPCHRGGRSSALHPTQCCYRAHSHPGSDKHACPPREPTAVGQACFKFAGDAPRGWGMSPSCFAGPAGHPRDDIVDPDTRCLFGPPCHQGDQPLLAIPSAAARGTRLTILCPSLRDPFRGRMATQPNVLPPSTIPHRHPLHPSIIVPLLRRGAGCYAGPHPCARSRGGSGHVLRT